MMDMNDEEGEGWQIRKMILLGSSFWCLGKDGRNSNGVAGNSEVRSGFKPIGESSNAGKLGACDQQGS
ncbi:hypothetical protein ACOSP7_016912 [Xanthoceras sorbifolium]